MASQLIFEPSVHIGGQTDGGQPPPGFEVDRPLQNVDLSTSDLYFVIANRDSDGVPSQVLTALIDGQSVSADYWLDQNGSKSSAPCG